MHWTKVACLAAVALCILGTSIWQSPGAEKTAFGHGRELLGFGFTFGTQTSFPSDFSDTNGWTHYGIYVGIIFAFFLLSGITISIVLCCGFYKGSRTTWTIVFSVVYGIMFLLCILAIAGTVAITTGIRQMRSSATTLTTTGVAGAFQNVRDSLGPLAGDFINLVNDTVNEIRNNSFIPVDDLVEFANVTLEESKVILNNASTVLNASSIQFDIMRNSFTILSQYQSEGFISGIPSNTSVPNVTALTAGLVSDAQSSIASMADEVANLTKAVDDAKAQVNSNSSTIQNAFKTINDTVNSILDNVDSFETSFDHMNISAYVSDSSPYQPYIQMQDEIRLPVMIFMLLMPLIMSGFWFFGRFTGHYKLMLVGYWWGAAICWLLLILAAIHVLLFIPTKDVCTHRDEVIQNAVTTMWGSNTNYSQMFFGITSPQVLVTNLDQAIGSVLSNPDLILACSGNQTIITQLNLDIPSIIGMRAMLDNATNEITDQVNAIPVADDIAQAQPMFSSMYNRIDTIISNITYYQDELANYTTEYYNMRGTWNSSRWWNQTAIDDAQQLIDDVNNMTNTIPYFDYWDYSNISSLDTNRYVTFTNSEKQRLSQDQQWLEELIYLNQTVITIQIQINLWANITSNLKVIFADLEGIVYQAQGLVDAAWLRVNNSVTLPTQVLDSMLSYLNPAIDNAIALAELPGLGRCAFIGDFIHSFFKQGFCGGIAAATGLVAVPIFALGYLWLLSWPIVLSSKTYFAGSHDKSDKDFWAANSQEMYSYKP